MGGLMLTEEKVTLVAAVAEAEAGGVPVGLPCPGFEGFEKRLEVGFLPASASAADAAVGGLKEGLRAIPRAELDAMLTEAACTIVSHLPNEHFDSYVLSESSLFVYPSRVVIKTCGTTRLLQAIPKLLESASRLSLFPSCCKYTRGTFMFPQAQLAPHGSFADEAALLDKHFGHLGDGGRAFVMGDALKASNWHIYVADGAAAMDSKKAHAAEPTYTLEMCMTKLDRAVAAQFFQEAGHASPAACTKASGIGELLPRSQIDDFLFEPCGYSMNGIEDGAHSTVHITPEDGFSYASFEAMGYGDRNLAGKSLGALVREVAATFKPGRFSLALHANGPPGKAGPGSWGGQLPVLEDYMCEGTSRQELPGGSAVVFHTFKALSLAGPQQHEVTPLALQDLGAEQEVEAVSKGVVTAQPVKELRQEGEDMGAATWDVLAKYGAAPAAVVAAYNPVLVASSDEGVDCYISSVVTSTGEEAAFYVLDLGMVLRLWKAWQAALPRVTPYYAVKCNPDQALLSILASLGAGFDVASKAEIAAVAGLGVGPDRMIFANPCKLPSHITAARAEGVALTTFDSESELRKLKKLHPGARAVLRLRADDRGARCPLGVKYGAEMEEAKGLLLVAKALCVHVEGVAFHVGSGASDPQSYADGISAAKALFDAAEDFGLPAMGLLDIGGGFTSQGGTGVSFAAAAAAINAALEEHFPVSMGVKVIGEPGRFFAEAPATLATHVFGTRFRGHGAARKAEYWINDGIYGSMNCLLYDHAELSARPLPVASKESEGGGGDRRLCSTIFGPTCDGLDTVLRGLWLPELECGDWLLFPRMGAYTQAAGSSFNGFETSSISTLYTYSAEGGEAEEEMLASLPLRPATPDFDSVSDSSGNCSSDEN